MYFLYKKKPLANVLISQTFNKIIHISVPGGGGGGGGGGGQKTSSEASEQSGDPSHFLEESTQDRPSRQEN